jgi:dynein heavy chain
MSWWQPGCEGDVPTKRSGHTLVLAMDGIKSHVLVFGGLQHSKKGSGPSNELFSLDINDPSRFKWTKVDAGGNKLPPGRWKHSACMDTDGGRMIVFGGFQSNNSRFNDVWVYNIEKQSWWQPPDSECELSATGAYTLKRKWDKVPTPRGAHSANIHDGKMWIFGGYGGMGYGRRDFDELCTLDLSSWTWDTVAPNGDPPECRSGHQSVVVKGSIYVSGGWNSTRQFNDLHIFDIEANTWSDTGVQWEIPRWNHAAWYLPALLSIPRYRSEHIALACTAINTSQLTLTLTLTSTLTPTPHPSPNPHRNSP